MRLTIQGIGVTGGFGCGVAELRTALEGRAVTPGEFTVPTGDGPVTIPALLASTGRLEEFVPKRALRRMDHFSKLALTGACLALADGDVLGSDLSRVGLVIASGYGATTTTFAFLDSIIADGDVLSSPTHFANSVHNAAAANVTMMLGIKGPCLTVSQFDLSVGSALMSARQWLVEGRCERVLFGAVDEISELVGYLWHRERALQPECDLPILGEGAAFFLLGREEAGRGYCAIDRVELGSGTPEWSGLCQEGLLLVDAGVGLGAVAGAIPPGARSLAGIHGSTPAGAGFDLAAAALLLEAQRAGGGTAQHACAVKLAGAEGWSAVSLSAIPD